MTTQCIENVDTAVDAPKCPECGGAGSISMFISPDEFGGVTCESCNGTGFQRGDDASICAMVETMAAQEVEQGHPLSTDQYATLDAAWMTVAPGTDLIGARLRREAAEVGA